MKSVLISIKPYWFYLIAEGIKTIEVRKAIPTADDWNGKCVCYMTKDQNSFQKIPEEFREKYRGFIGKVGMEFDCKNTIVVDCDSVYPFNQATRKYINREVRFGRDEFFEYTGGRCGFGWCVSNLFVYDKPRELGEFYKAGSKTLETLIDEDALCAFCAETEYGKLRCYGTPNGPVMCEGSFCDSAFLAYREERAVSSPPQSWCYICDKDGDNL